MRKITIMAALLAAVTAGAQNLNPTVQVTTAYEGRMMDVAKQTPAMAIPDSVLKFDWNFDYAVFDSPYKGSYEFSPYLMDLRPEALPVGGGEFYLRAGAGYGLHPELTAVWAPRFVKAPLDLVVYDTFSGYYGGYRDQWLHCEGPEEHLYSIYPIRKKAMDGSGYMSSVGSDLSNRLGADASLRLKRLGVTAGIGYDFIGVTFPKSDGGVRKAAYNGVDFSAGVKGNVGPVSLGGDATFRIGKDWDLQGPLGGRDLDFSAKAGYEWGDFLFSFGVNGQMAAVDTVSMTAFEFVPAAEWRMDRLHAKAELAVATTSGTRKGHAVYPRLAVDYILVPDLMKVFAGLEGGNSLNTLHSLRAAHHFIEMDQALLGNSPVLYNAFLGFQGRVMSNLQYRLDAGLAGYSGAVMDCVSQKGLNLYDQLRASGSIDTINDYAIVPFSSYCLADYRLAYADIKADWKSEHIEAGTALRFQKASNIRVDEAPALFVFAPSAMLGNAYFTYTWNKRISAGLTADWATRRSTPVIEGSPEGTEGYDDLQYTAPGWVDLGLNAEYRFTKKLTFWAKGGNLLGQTVRRELSYAEKAPYFTLGICLNL